MIVILSTVFTISYNGFSTKLFVCVVISTLTERNANFNGMQVQLYAIYELIITCFAWSRRRFWYFGKFVPVDGRLYPRLMHDVQLF